MCEIVKELKNKSIHLKWIINSHVCLLSLTEIWSWNHWKRQKKIHLKKIFKYMKTVKYFVSFSNNFPSNSPASRNGCQQSWGLITKPSQPLCLSRSPTIWVALSYCEEELIGNAPVTPPPRNAAVPLGGGGGSGDPGGTQTSHTWEVTAGRILNGFAPPSCFRGRHCWRRRSDWTSARAPGWSPAHAKVGFSVTQLFRKSSLPLLLASCPHFC